MILKENDIREELIELGVTQIELMQCRRDYDIKILVARKIHSAAFNAAVKPWRKVLGTDTE